MSAALVRDVNQFLRDWGVAPARFGREACGDPAFVSMIRLGRVAGPELEASVRAFMAAVDGAPKPTEPPTGAELVEELRAAADNAGAPLWEYVKPLATSNPHSWLAALQLSKHPHPLTVERIRARIAARPIPAARRSPNSGPSACAKRFASGEHLEGAIELERKQALGERAHAERRPGETLAQCAARLGDDAARSEARASAERRRAREIIEIDSPSALVRRAERDWPEQSGRVAAIAAEMGVAKGEAWERVIKAGIDSLTGGE